MQKQCMNVVIVGHVDHGKSTIIGRILADTNSLPIGKLEKVKLLCEKNNKTFEYAFLLDALKDEQSQGITIDMARCFFKTKKRKYLILDAPGHIEFLKNMITGAANAEAAFLVIDAKEGIRENTKRHSYILSLLDVNQIVILVNKMDLVQHSQAVFNTIVKGYSDVIKSFNFKPIVFIPISGKNGDNIANPSENLSWYDGPTVVDILDNLKKNKLSAELPFRMPVQDIYKFSGGEYNNRVIVGRVESGKIAPGEKIIFYPSGKCSIVDSIDLFGVSQPNIAKPGESIGLKLKEQIYIKRGEIAAKLDEKKLNVSTSIKVRLFWLGNEPLSFGKDYYFKLGTSKVKAVLKAINHVMDSSTLTYFHNGRSCVNKHEVAECILELYSPIAFDLSNDGMHTCRFVVVDNYDIVGGGKIQENLIDKMQEVRDEVQLRNQHWIPSGISRTERLLNYQQKPLLIIVTGRKNSGRKIFARQLERKFFYEGKKVYYLGIGNLSHGLNADIKNTENNSQFEYLRRFSEILNILLDVGLIVITTAAELTQDDIDLIENVTLCDSTCIIWVGEKSMANIDVDLYLPIDMNVSDKCKTVINYLKSHVLHDIVASDLGA